MMTMMTMMLILPVSISFYANVNDETDKAELRIKRRRESMDTQRSISTPTFFAMKIPDVCLTFHTMPPLPEPMGSMFSKSSAFSSCTSEGLKLKLAEKGGKAKMMTTTIRRMVRKRSNEEIDEIVGASDECTMCYDMKRCDG